METTTIRVPLATRDRLNALAKKTGTPAGEIVSRLVLEADDDALLREAESSWAQLISNPDALDAYRAETKTLTQFDDSMPAY